MKPSDFIHPEGAAALRQKEQLYTYFAFISYSSKDTEWGKKKQKKLLSHGQLNWIRSAFLDEPSGRSTFGRRKPSTKKARRSCEYAVTDIDYRMKLAKNCFSIFTILIVVSEIG